MSYKLNSVTISSACKHFGTSTHVKSGLLIDLSKKGYGGEGGACAMSNSYGVGGKGQYAPDLYNYYYYGWSGGSGIVAIW